ncbi:MAG TPA: alpha/beta hydrolase [Dehalococcoidia bacterium]|nr:alpha/beta hydrolase [Dehalococcoidia bacterium]
MKLWLKVIIGVVVLVIVIIIGISAYLGGIATRVDRESITIDPADLGLEYENITFPSREDHLTLHGWFLPSPNSEEIIIILHGAESNRCDINVNVMGIAAELISLGYNVLMFDFRGHGESEGERISAGFHERKDLWGAVDFARERGFEKIGVLGFSMGAATALMGAAEEPDIDCVVADSSFADMEGIMEGEFTERTKFPGFFITPVLYMVKIMYGVDFTAVKPVESVPEIAPRPIMFIHGEKDDFVPLDHAYRLYQASQNPDNILWIVPGAEHVKGYITSPAEYINRITAFFDKVLK